MVAMRESARWQPPGTAHVAHVVHAAHVAHAARCVAPHAACLRACGFLRRAPAGAAGGALHEAYRWVALAATTAYLLQECIYTYQARGDMEALARVLFLLLCHVTSLVKQLVLHARAASLDRLLAALHDPVFNEDSPGARALTGACARSARRLQRAYAGTAVLTCTLWITFPLARFARGQHVEFPFWTGVDCDRPLGFAAVLVYSYYVTTLVGIANTTMDAFMATILYQCKTQLTILRMNIESLLERADEIKTNSGMAYDDIVMKLFVDCLVHYNKICEEVALLQDIFGTAILVQFGVGGWILCMAAYKVVSLDVLSVEFASMNLFIVCILTELFLYCYYGNEVTVESARLVEAAYAGGWERARAGRRLRAALLLSMVRARRPLRPAAGRVVPLSLETFLKILKSSYTFYAVLRQTK